ncbi:MAG: hypothetical protein K2V38_29510, partial [Gemmataceae bacterium]|nr:hypothetical protein [Gemmataceae bacterium]
MGPTLHAADTAGAARRRWSPAAAPDRQEALDTGIPEASLPQSTANTARTYLEDRKFLLPFLGGYVVAALFATGLFYLDERCPWRLRPTWRDWILDRKVIPLYWPQTTMRAYLLGRARGPVPQPMLVLHAIGGLVFGLAVVVLAGLLVVVGVYAVRDPSKYVTGLVTLVCLLFIVVALLYGFFEFYFQLHRVVVVVGALVLMGWNATGGFRNEDRDGRNNYKLQFPGLEAGPDGREVNVRLWDRGQKDGGLDVRATLDATARYAESDLIPGYQPLQSMSTRWQNQPGRADQKPKIVVVCTSGGGIRAAVWTGVVLHELERDPKLPGFRDHIRLVTGASGGMVGATLYVADFENPGGFTEGHIAALGADSLTRTGQSLVVRDLLWNTVFVPPWHHAGGDRGRMLEYMWAHNAWDWLGRPTGAAFAGWPNPWDKTFLDLRELERFGRRPSLIYSPLMVEDSRRLLLSNLDLSGLDDPTELATPRGRDYDAESKPMNLNLAIGPHGAAGRSA